MTATHTLDAEVAFAQRILPQVSRTFALTIPQLPSPLCAVVTNAYLLCRIADTVEDEPTLSAATKDELQSLLLAAITSTDPDERFSVAAAPLLSAQTLPAEHELVRGAHHVFTQTRAFPARQRNALTRCLRIMCEGMGRFQRQRNVEGLATLTELREYCYVVAGVVGEMLTDLFCSQSTLIEARRSQLMRQSRAFGRGLQMTNILKDIWEDRAAQRCWLPRDVFAQNGIDLSTLNAGHNDPRFTAGLETLIGLAHANLREALAYTQAIPKSEVGIRRFCLWSIGLAVLTLRNIAKRPFFSAAQEVKVSRRAVRGTILLSNVAGRSNRVIGGVFNWLAADLPLLQSATVAPATGSTGT